jgi:hypothetical protein
LLDNDTLEETLVADDGHDTVEAEGQDTLAAEEEVVISIEGEEPEPDPDAEVEAELGEAGKRALKAAREAAKEAAKEAREAKARLAEIEAATKPKEPELKRPTLEDCGFNEDVYAENLAKFLAADEKRKADEAKAKQAEKAANDAYEAKRTKYFDDRAKVGVDADAEARVVSKLNAQQQTALMKASRDPAKVVAALAKTPKVLDQLSATTDIIEFVYLLAQTEGKITVTTKAPPPPESKLRGGVAVPAGNLTAQLEAAEKRADQTGDRTEVIRIRRAIREAGIKA